jgi:hypothetical protein
MCGRIPLGKCERKPAWFSKVLVVSTSATDDSGVTFPMTPSPT